MERRVKPLSKVTTGGRGRIVCSLGYGQGLLRRMADMGLDEGSEVEVILSGGGGPILVGVKDTRLAIGRGMAEKIMVEEGS